MGLWDRTFGTAKTRVDDGFRLNVRQVVAACLALHQYEPPPQMRHLGYDAQADDLLVAALRGDAKAKQVLTEAVAYFSDPGGEATIRSLMQRALGGDQTAQKQAAELLEPLVAPPPQTFVVYADDSNPEDSEQFFSWDEALAFARGLAKGAPDAYVTIHPRPRVGSIHYKIHSSGDVEKIDLSKYGI